MYRRVHVVERELIRRHLTVGVHVPLAEEQEHLMLRELRVRGAQSDDVERQVPSREPGIFPAVRHRQDISAVDVAPVAVPARETRARRRRRDGIAIQPIPHDVVIELLGPL